MNRFRWRNVQISDSYAEAFSVAGTRIIVTAETEKWCQIAAAEATGYGTSVIACDAEAGIDAVVDREQSPDGRPGVALMFFAFNTKALSKAILKRAGQCLLTCPTTAVFDGTHESAGDGDAIELGSQLRFFGDGFQASKVIGETRYWRIPVMDGEFLCVEKIGSFKGVGGGNLLIGGRTQQTALAAAEKAVAAIQDCPQVITPFPGGIVRSGSKVGSQYEALHASTNEAFCPTLRARVESELLEETAAVYEIIIDGRSYEHVAAAMKAGLNASVELPDVTEIAVGNYGGKLGKHLFHLRELIEQIDLQS